MSNEQPIVGTTRSGTVTVSGSTSSATLYAAGAFASAGHSLGPGFRTFTAIAQLKQALQART